MRITHTITIFAAGALLAVAQPKLSSVSANLIFNAASWESVDVPGGGLAPGSEFITNDVPWFVRIPGGFQCPQPGELSITVKPANGDALLTQYVPMEQCSQVRGILPPETPPGPADLTFSVSGRTIQTVHIEVVPSRFGIFTKQKGQGAAIAQNYAGDAQLVTNGLLAPALTGQIVTIWGTGLGTHASGVTVHLGDVAIQPQYAGPAPTLPGIDQINFAIPDGVPNSCYVPVQVEVNGVLSNETTIAKADHAGACDHPLGLNAATLAALDAGQSILAGSVSIAYFDRSSGPGTWLPATLAAGQFSRLTAAGIQAMSGSLRDNDTTPSCRFGFTYDPGYSPPTGAPAGPEFGSPVFSNSTAIRLEGPNTQTAIAQSYGYLPLAAFPPGDWRISLTGDGSTSLVSTLAVPRPPQWVNRPEDLADIDRNKDLTLQWNPEGYSNTDLVTAGIEWEVPYPQNIRSASVRSLDCTARATAGTITIPSSLLRQIPATPSFPDAYPHTLTLSLRKDFAHRQLTTLMNTGSAIPAFGLIGYSLNQSVWINVR